MMVPCCEEQDVFTTMRIRTRIFTLMTMTGLMLLAQAPPPPDGQQAPASDPPGRAARLGMIEGTVSFEPAGVEDWAAAAPNRPLTTGDRLWVDNGSRAEVHLGSAAFRLNAKTNFSFINLDDHVAQVQLSTGTMNVRVRHLADDETLEIDTPQAALTILRPGEYRVDVSEQGDASIVTVRQGSMEATSGQAVTINPREQVRIMGGGNDGEPATFDRRPAPVPDGFDNFCMDRDRREDMSISARYVSHDIPGYYDLDGAGDWRPAPGYGTLWFPRVAVGWAPYRYGHWAWIAPWGWTWVDDAPWGYAPFHYGRWVFVGGAWGWVPGPLPGPGVVVARPVYAPALVAWVGGAGFGVSVGIGAGPAVGWFALGPREVFVPPYAYSPAYIERVNVTNTVIVNRGIFVNVNAGFGSFTYVNRTVPGAVVAVPGGVMVAGRPVGAAAVIVRPEVVERVQVTRVVAVVPERAAVFGGRAVVAAAPPAVVVNRTVVTRMAPPPPPVAFEHQRAAIAANPNQPFNHAAVRASAPAPARPAYYRPAGGPAPRPGPAARPEMNRPEMNRPEMNRPENRPGFNASRPEARPEPRPAQPRPNVEARPNPEPRPNVEPRPNGRGGEPRVNPEGRRPQGEREQRGKETRKEKEKQ